jgi:hypothetical protein
VLVAAFVPALVWGRKIVGARLAERLAGAPIGAVDGDVIWSGSTWTAMARTPMGPRKLEDISLPPGPYRFYLHGARIVGAESPFGPGFYSIAEAISSSALLNGSSRRSFIHIGDLLTYMTVIGQKLGFSFEELELNRKGWLSPRQGGGQAFSTVGQLQLRWGVQGGERQPRVDYVWVLGGESIPVVADMATVVVPGIHYRVYRAPGGRLVSLEPLLSFGR